MGQCIIFILKRLSDEEASTKKNHWSLKRNLTGQEISQMWQLESK